AGCTSGTSDTTGKQLSVNVGPEPDTIDPALNSSVDGGTIIIHLFEGLMIRDKDGKIQPGQTETYTISEDKLTYTFTLRKGLKWSDGKDLKASDFTYAWNRAVNPNTAADYENMFAVIKGYSATYAEGDTAEQKKQKDEAVIAAKKENKALEIVADDAAGTIKVTLNSVCPYFLELCAFPTYMPVRKDVVEANPEKWATDAATYISNGSYKMKEWIHNSKIVMEKNKNYWDVEKIGPDTINFVLMEDDASRLSAYKNNELQFIDDMPQDELDALKKQSDFYKKPQLGTYYISFNTKKAPLDNAKIREALLLAINRQFICDNIGKTGQIPAGAYVPYGLTDADITKEFREVGKKEYFAATDYEGNLEKAKKLLAEAGYPEGKGFPAIEYLYNEGTQHQQIGEAIQNDWKKLGIEVKLVSQEWSVFLNSRKNGDYFVARNGWLGDYNDPISYLDMWITGGGNNDAQWSNAQYDQLIKQIKASSDNAERMKLMNQAEDINFSESMLCPIYY
ncbi:MAG: peptide ABC transporter substrate-binding protein, partial [Oscillospiraceae bacterium]